MKNIYIMSGEEFILKQDKLCEIRDSRKEWNYKKLILENSKTDTVKKVINDSFMYLTTIDMFNLNPKILYIVAENAKVSADILGELIDDIGDNVLILDIRNKDIRSLLSNRAYKKNASKIELLKFNKLEEKTRNSTIMDIKDMFKNSNIEFETNEDADICANYIYDNSDYSYTAIRQQIEQLKYISDKTLSKEDIYGFVSQSFNGNYYALINNIFASKTKTELMEMLEINFVTFDKSDYISFFNIFLYTLKDYLRFINKTKCKNGSNYYQFKNSKLEINNVDKLILKIANLNFECRTSTKEVKEELLILMWNHFEQK